jgi:hypothetical protein
MAVGGGGCCCGGFGGGGGGGVVLFTHTTTAPPDRVLECMNVNNLQLLTGPENSSKGGKFTSDQEAAHALTKGARVIAALVPVWRADPEVCKCEQCEDWRADHGVCET